MSLALALTAGQVAAQQSETEATPTVQSTPSATPPVEPTVTPQPTATQEPSPMATAAVEATALPATEAPSLLPTATIEPSATAIPTAGGPLPMGEQPLRLSHKASLTQALPGQEFRYSVRLDAAQANGIIQLQTIIDQNIDLIKIGLTSGSCDIAKPVICRILLNENQNASIEITARVSPAAVPGTVLISQAIAQDQSNNTAASDQVYIEVIAPPEAAAPNAELLFDQNQFQSTPSPTPLISDEGAPPTATRRPPTRTPQPTRTVANDDNLLNTATPTIIESPGEPLLLQPTSTEAPATAAPANTAQPIITRPTIRPTMSLPPSRPDPNPPLLPNTAATGPLLGIALGLLGFALIVFGTRRVRDAGVRLARQSIIAARLTPLLAAISYLQHRTTITTNEMDTRSREMQERTRSLTE